MLLVASASVVSCVGLFVAWLGVGYFGVTRVWVGLVVISGVL